MSKFKVGDRVKLKARVLQEPWRRYPPDDWPMAISEMEVPGAFPRIWYWCVWALKPGSEVNALFPEDELETWPETESTPEK